ncbi:hypothetical protein, partial [Microbacterium sp. AG790]|uniref:hypothetical protein n=1 Tax=Microbacterium sp. AG790 TaxID=2183995 RepID=UPI001C7DCAD6
TPTAAGTFTFEVTGTNGFAPNVTHRYTITITTGGSGGSGENGSGGSAGIVDYLAKTGAEAARLLPLAAGALLLITASAVTLIYSRRSRDTENNR